MWQRSLAMAALLLAGCSGMKTFLDGNAGLPKDVIQVPAAKAAEASSSGCPSKVADVPWRVKLRKEKSTADSSVWIDKECRCAMASFSTWDSAKQVLGEESTRRIRNIITSGGSFTSLTAQDRQALKQFSESLLWMPSPIEGLIGKARFEQFRDKILTKENDVDQLLPKVKKTAEQLAKQYPELPVDLKIAVVDGLSGPGTSLPGGYVVLGRAFVRTAKDDQLVFVLSHEISHIARRHESKALQVKIVGAEQTYELFRTAVKTLEGGQSATDILGSATSIQQSIAFLGNIGLDYEQNLELEADSCGAPATRNAGFDPAQGWRDYKEYYGSNASARSSHPPTSEREANLKKVLTSMRTAR